MKKLLNDEKLYKIFQMIVCAGIIIVISFFMLANLRSVSEAVGSFFGIIASFVWGFFFALIMYKVAVWIEKMLPGKMNAKTKRFTASVLAILCLIAIIILFFILLIPQITASVVQIGSLIQNYSQLASKEIEVLINKYHFSDDIASTLMSYSSSAAKIVWNLTSKYIPDIISLTTSLVSATGKLVIGLIVALYILIDRDRLSANFKAIMAAFFDSKTYSKAVHVVEISVRKFTDFVAGKALDSFIIGMICFVAMKILKMDYSLLISVIIGLTNMIPFFGPIIGAVPCGLILLLSEPVSALEFLILIIILQQLDGNVIGPKILGDSVGVSSIGIIFAIILFGGYFGVAGMFIGVPIYAVITSLIDEAVEEKLKLKGINKNEL